jgi:hypothetical protein
VLTKKERLAMMRYIAERRSRKRDFLSTGAVMDDVAKYNDRMYYGFLILFTLLAAGIAYMVH